MTHYLIDIRLMGSVRQQIRDLSTHLHQKFNLGDKGVIPHISLVGPFFTHDEEKLVEDFTRISASQAEIPKYTVGGYGFFDDSRVVFVTITPDATLKQFRHQLSLALSPYCSLRKYDRDGEDEFRFHATLAMKLDWLTFQRIKWYFRRQEPILYRHHPIRVTLLRNTRILCEYDFIQQRMLSRSQALSRATWKRDVDMLKAWDYGIWE
ncbi:2'-5' RNA ligase family protein [Methanoregula sp.]|uniref:2'-5' RNA ligase family protein n=1 Tax=Methanoregula sp. TaxID=2052170 RepID=UPI003BB0516B